ncbi:MAG: glycosyltransferase family 4 protein [Myxococcales bacterium]|nr:glycosyltransferase family 4 protein [Myxococcales bacterium]
MRLIVFNLLMDADDPVLGFASGWVRSLAARCSRVEVLTMRAGRVAVPENVVVHSVGKEHGYSEPRRALNFYRFLWKVLRQDGIYGCFSHMMPVFSALGGPLLRARGIPLVTWYAHPSLTATLRLAHTFSDRMVASLATAYPYKRDKLTVIGQGIDTSLFSPGHSEPEDPPFVLCAGRLSAVKDHGTLLRAVAALRSRGRALRVVILGSTPEGGEAYAQEVRSLVRLHHLEEIVQFRLGVSAPALRDWYRRCTAHVNLTPAGFGDKVAWEAMACERPSLVANTDFMETLGRHADALLFTHGDADDLAAKLERVLGLSAPERASMGAYLRSQVQRLHGLDSLADRILSVFEEIRACRDAERRGAG